MKKLFILAALAFSFSSFGTNALKVEDKSPPVSCVYFYTSCGPEGDVCGATDDDVWRNLEFAENYWCG